MGSNRNCMEEQVIVLLEGGPKEAAMPTGFGEESKFGRTSKTTVQKTGIASNILDTISQGNESQHTLEKCIAYSQPFGDYAQVPHSQVLMIYRTIASTIY